MNRRTFLQMPTAAAAAASWGTSLGWAQNTAQRQGRPNIIFILSDDLGYGDLGCYGQKEILTPNLDRMAQEGTRFTQAYAGATVCAPSRCCLMTGLHGGHATVRGNKKPEVGLRAGEATVASVLKDAGYRTALYGKWGLGGPGTGSVPNTRGFESFYGYLDQQHAHNSYPEHLWDNQNEVFLTGNWFNQRKVFSNDLFTERALKWVESASGSPQPFFLYLSYTGPHANNELGQVQKNGMEVPDQAPYKDRNWPDTEKSFAALITHMDRDIGKLMEALRRTGADQNTLVVFSSDNGPHKEGGHDPDFFLSRGPLRGIKRDLYEGGIRVPFLARWPGQVPAGKVSEEVVAFWDLLPTFAEFAGAKAPTGIDGQSVAGAMLGRAQAEHRPLYWEFHEGGFKQAVRWRQWKAVRLGTRRPTELYDLSTDVGERRNAAAEQPDIARKLTELMSSSRVDSPHFPITERV